MSQTARAADALLRTVEPSEGLTEFINRHRTAGNSWADIATKLNDATAGVIDVSWMTVRRWADIEGAA